MQQQSAPNGASETAPSSGRDHGAIAAASATQGILDADSQGALRRLALARQGLQFREQIITTIGDDAPTSAERVSAVVAHLGALGIDTTAVVMRAHHHSLWNRLRGYRVQDLDAAIAERRVFEYWSHAAAYLPMRDYRFAQVKMRAMREGKDRWIRSKDERLMRRIKKRIASDGPLTLRELESNRTSVSARIGSTLGWWDWKPSRDALLQLFLQGELMVVAGHGQNKRYDLRERVLPDNIDTRFPTTDEYADYLIDMQLRTAGAMTEACCSYLRNGKELRRAIHRSLQERLRAGRLDSFERAGVTWYLDGERERPAKSQQHTIRILSPFDNLIVQRDRLQGVFGFDYVLENHVPEAKRRYGYFALPVLVNDEFVARLDCKAHRNSRVFEIRGLHWEPGAVAPELLGELGAELAEFARFNGCRRLLLDLPSEPEYGALKAELAERLNGYEF
ncbi:MAG: crosslink repair DNA glycosylase YcaQ family protein [Pseudomonadota bacterium]